MLLVLSGLVAGPVHPLSLEKIEALANRGRSEEALRQLEDLLVHEPGSFQGQLLRGALLSELRRNIDAERVFHALSRQFPDRPEPLHNLAVLKALEGRAATAVVALEDLLARHPDFEPAARNLATIRSAPAAGEFDPLSPNATRVSLVLVTKPSTHAGGGPGSSSFPTPDATPEAADVTPAPTATRASPEPAAASQKPEPAVMAPEPEPLPTQPQATGATFPQDPANAARPPTTEAAPTEALKPAVSNLRVELAEMVKAWAAAWSEQRVKEYLAFYAADFEPADFASRPAWEAMRRQRVAAPSFIEVEVDLDSMVVHESNPGEASATFTQSYRSDRFGDTVEKTLDLVREQGAWRIRRENSR